MLDLMKKGIEAGEARGAEYTEVRGEDCILTVIGYSDGHIDNLTTVMQHGVACRVLYDGKWGFACGKAQDVQSSTEKACSLARTASRGRNKIVLAEIDPAKDDIKKQYRMPPHHVSLEEKVSRLKKLTTLIRMYDERIKATSLAYTDSHGYKYLLTNEGTEITQEVGHVFTQCWVTAKENNRLTAAKDQRGSTQQGYEYFEKESEEKMAERIGKRVIQQLEGKRVKNGTFPCVLGPRVVGVLAHEALGHLAEADLTVHSSFKGKLGEKIASDNVTMVDAPLEKGFGTTSYDDEGVYMQKVTIINNGILQGILTNREYAQRLGMPPSGSARAENFLVPPLIRMRTTYIEEGDHTNEELFEGIDFGYYCKDYRGGEAQLNSSFQVGIQEAFEIENGEIGSPVKDLAISGMATETLFSIDAVGSDLEFGSSYCGKAQSVPVSMGGPHVRIRKGGILLGGVK
ncbi:MAG: TldD/PmbA family protein [Theionarchaea archaeon]|nr:TldD/PmbA family protein [Theionarchaea archaeon]